MTGEENNTVSTQESLNGSSAPKEEQREQSIAPVDGENNNNDDGNNNEESEGNNTPTGGGGGYKGNNEDRKIFVGGIAYDVSNDDLSSHFSQYGEVTQAQVKFDRTTGRSRGFAFVEFVTTEACKTALTQREQLIKNKQCEIKPAKSREVNKKVFVGGLPADHPEEELRKHFEQFGIVEDIEWPYDKMTRSRRNFAFIVFEEEEAADRAANVSKQTFGSREADVKKAVPQNKRNNVFMPRGPIAGLGRGYGPGVGSLRGGPSLAVHSAASQWFNNSLNNGWGQMSGVPYATGGSGTTASWGDWYGNAAANAANFYAQGVGSGSNSYGGTAYSNGYDHHQHQYGNHGGAGGLGGRLPHAHSGGGHSQQSHGQNGQSAHNGANSNANSNGNQGVNNNASVVGGGSQRYQQPQHQF